MTLGRSVSAEHVKILALAESAVLRCGPSWRDMEERPERKDKDRWWEDVLRRDLGPHNGLLGTRQKSEKTND